MNLKQLILTCEHAGNRIPDDWKKRFSPESHVLKSHRGIDIGAKELSLYLENELKCPFFFHEETRLLIELNRSLHHPKLFSEYSKKFTKSEKKELIDTFYLPYRNKVEKEIQKKIKGGCVLHLSMHTFTPQLDGIERDVEIGLLYDPARAQEKAFCQNLRRILKNKLPKEYRIKLNKPYQGKADGFTTYLRKLFSGNEYIGIEIEVNQKLASLGRIRTEVAKALASSIRLSIL